MIAGKTRLPLKLFLALISFLVAFFIIKKKELNLKIINIMAKKTSWFSGFVLLLLLLLLLLVLLLARQISNSQNLSC